MWVLDGVDLDAQIEVLVRASRRCCSSACHDGPQSHCPIPTRPRPGAGRVRAATSCSSLPSESRARCGVSAARPSRRALLVESSDSRSASRARSPASWTTSSSSGAGAFMDPGSPACSRLPPRVPRFRRRGSHRGSSEFVVRRSALLRVDARGDGVLDDARRASRRPRRQRARRLRGRFKARFTRETSLPASASAG